MSIHLNSPYIQIIVSFISKTEIINGANCSEKNNEMEEIQQSTICLSLSSNIVVSRPLKLTITEHIRIVERYEISNLAQSNEY